MLIQKSTDFNINLNAKGDHGQTVFHFACKNGKSKIAEILMKKSVEFSINLNALDNFRRTGFHLACIYGYSELDQMFIQKSAEFNIDLYAKDVFGKTGFDLKPKTFSNILKDYMNYIIPYFHSLFFMILQCFA